MPDSSMHDKTLATALAGFVELARPMIEKMRNDEKLGYRMWPTDRAFLGWIETIEAAISAHPVLNIGVFRFFGNMPLSLTPKMQARNLLAYAVDHGPDEAVAWLHRVYSKKLADVMLMGEVYGLALEDTLELANGVKLVPFPKLVPSSTAQQIWASHFLRGPGGGHSSMTPPVCIILTISNVISDEAHIDSSTGQLIRSTNGDVKLIDAKEAIADAVLALTLVNGAAPVLVTQWMEFIDPELSRAESSRGWSAAYFEGSLPFNAVGMGECDIDLVGKYISLDSKEKDILRIALHRLNMARRRADPGNKAIDGAICLEALLGDKDNKNELTYRLRLRSAMLLGSNLTERRRIKKAVNDFYGLRSKVVHGGTIKPEDMIEYINVAEDGLAICSHVIEKIIQIGYRPDMTEIELMGGFEDKA